MRHLFAARLWKGVRFESWDNSTSCPTLETTMSKRNSKCVMKIAKGVSQNKNTLKEQSSPKLSVAYACKYPYYASNKCSTGNLSIKFSFLYIIVEPSWACRHTLRQFLNSNPLPFVQIFIYKICCMFLLPLLLNFSLHSPNPKHT